MSEVQIECQGLPCPQPVLKCKNAIESQAPETISIIVDNDAAKENVSRFLETQGYQANVESRGEHFAVIGSRTEECQTCEAMSSEQITAAGNKRHLVFIASDVIGSGDDELGAKLMYNFLLTLEEMGDELWRIVMVNGGVKLSVADNPCMEVLKKLENSGVSVLVCGTCLEHFGLTEAKEVGDVTNMLDIITSFQLASNTIRV